MFADDIKIFRIVNNQTEADLHQFNLNIPTYSLRMVYKQ